MPNRYVRLTSKMLGDMKIYGKENYCNKDEEWTMSNTTLIQKILYDAFLHCLNYKKANRNTSVKVVIKAEQNDTCKKDMRISFRLSDQMCIILEDYYGNSDELSFVVRCAIRDVLNNNRRPTELAKDEKIRFMVGQKNSQMTEWINGIFNDIKHRRTSLSGYSEVFVGTANVFLHLDAEIIAGDNILNDNSEHGCNLLQVIKNYPVELKKEILSLSISADGFERAKKELKGIKLTSKKKRVRAAALFFFLCNCSVYGKAEYYHEKKRFLYLVDVISAVHKKLENVEITKRDALYHLNKLMNVSNHLLFFDPPYIGTEDYYQHQNSNRKVFRLHQELRNRIMRLKENNVCIVTYRVTSSETMKSKGYTDVVLKRQLDELYLNRGFYIAFKPLKRTRGQIEILISSEQFYGSTPYTSSLVEMEVQ